MRRQEHQKTRVPEHENNLRLYDIRYNVGVSIMELGHRESDGGHRSLELELELVDDKTRRQDDESWSMNTDIGKL
jgi:hypothetical protein